MPQERARRGSPDVFSFEGSGDDARLWLDTVYGTNLRLTGPLGGVEHHRADHGAVVFDYIRIDASYSFDSDPMPTLVVVDVLHGAIEYVRDGMTDRVHDGDSVLVAGWDMAFSGVGDFPELRTTSLPAAGLLAAIEEADPDFGQRLIFTSYVPHSPGGGRALARDRRPDQLDAARQRDHGAGGGGRVPPGPHPAAHLPQQRRRTRHAARGRPRRRGRLALDRASRRADHRGPRVGGAQPRATSPASATSPRAPCSTPSASIWAAPPRTTCGASGSTSYAATLRDGTSLSVSDAAAAHGFFNPGRFASDYRQVFDENPRETRERSNS